MAQEMDQMDLVDAILCDTTWGRITVEDAATHLREMLKVEKQKGFAAAYQIADWLEGQNRQRAIATIKQLEAS